MPINSPNFLQAETQDYNGYGNLLENALKGYEMARKPKQIGQEEQYRELVNTLTGHQGRKAGIEADYLPREKDMSLALNQQKYDWNPQRWGADIGLKGSQARHYDLANKLTEQYGAQEKEADIEYKKRLAKYGHLQHLTAPEKIAARVLGFDKLDSPEGRRLVAELNGIPATEIPGDPSYVGSGNNKQIPEGAVPMIGWPAPAKTAEIAEQRKLNTQIQSWKEIDRLLLKADAILQNNPGIGESAASVIENASHDKKGYLKPILKNIPDQKNRSDVEKLDKIYADVALKLESAMPGKGSVFKLNMIQQAKGRSSNANETNLFINQGLRQEGKPYLDFEPKLKAIRGRYSLPFEINDYSIEDNLNKNNPTQELANSLTADEKSEEPPPGSKKGINMYGEEQYVKPEDIEDFKLLGGRML